MKEQVEAIKKKLRNYIYLHFEAENLYERWARLKSAEVFPSSPEGNGGGGFSQPNPHRQENAIIRRMEHEAKMAGRIEVIQAEMDEIEDAIDSLCDPLEREVLRLRYMDGENNRHMKWTDVALHIYGDDDEPHVLAAHRLHGRALVSLAKTTGFADYPG